ncbi:extragenic suppressor of the bimD6 mutation [Coccidioides immitis H538.4]|uniref:non-specific serine/threonine protein kinase n=1 Tax=Coccidioides immitis H538.4 TaxID=396776 RepID=A0A0J8S6S2_COCIT|nr:extragenic suppressor of the bimD6 mutation [Coccidioides immitis H538.4]
MASTEATIPQESAPPDRVVVLDQNFDTPPKEILPEGANEKNSEEGLGEEEDEYYDDIFADDFDDEDFFSSNPADYTKSYNRQRRLNEAVADPNAPKSSYPKSNPQKPTVNTHAKIDDQISALSRHADETTARTISSLALEVAPPKGAEKSDRATSEQVDRDKSVEHDHPRSLEFLRMDIKNVSDFFRRKGVDTLPERTLFEFIISSEGPRMLNGSNEPMIDALEKLFATRSDSQDADNAELDTAVFRQQYIPQTLEQVYDVERDVEKLQAGEGEDLVYRDLLANRGKVRTTDEQTSAAIEEGSDESGGVSVSEGESEAEGEAGSLDPFAKKAPRGKRFEDKEAKRDHKRQVKEEKREQRAKKIPKHIKKKLINATKRK